MRKHWKLLSYGKSQTSPIICDTSGPGSILALLAEAATTTAASLAGRERVARLPSVAVAKAATAAAITSATIATATATTALATKATATAVAAVSAIATAGASARKVAAGHEREGMKNTNSQLGQSYPLEKPKKIRCDALFLQLRQSLDALNGSAIVAPATQQLICHLRFPREEVKSADGRLRRPAKNQDCLYPVPSLSLTDRKQRRSRPSTDSQTGRHHPPPPFGCGGHQRQSFCCGWPRSFSS